MVVIHGGNREKIAALTRQPVDSLLDFSANINPLGVPTAARATLVAALDELNDYPNPDYPRLKTAIARHHHVNLADVFVGNGAVQLIFNAALALEVKEALILAPCFGEYERALTKTHAHVNRLYLSADKNFQVDVDELIRRLQYAPSIGLVCLGNPNNPTGINLNGVAMRQLVNYCNQHQIWLILDEAFMDLTLSAHGSWLPQLTAQDHVLVVRSMTKLFAIPGLRLGYAITKNPELQQRLTWQNEPWSINIVAARFGEQAFKYNTYIRQTQDWLRHEQPWLEQQLNRIPFLKVYPSCTNFFLLKSNRARLREQLWSTGILIRDCSDYEGLTAGYYRVAVKDRAANQQLLQQLRLLGFAKEMR